MEQLVNLFGIASDCVVGGLDNSAGFTLFISSHKFIRGSCMRLKDEAKENDLAREHSTPILEDYSNSWNTSLAWQNPDMAYQLFSNMSEEYLSSRARGHRYLAAHERGRGAVRFCKHNTCAPASCDPEVGSTTVKCVRLKGLLRRAEELHKKCHLRGSEVLSFDPEAKSLVLTIQRGAGSLAPHLDANCGSAFEIRELCNALRVEVGCEQAMLVEQRKLQWQQATRCNWHTNRKEIFDLVKDKTPGNLSILRRQDGSYTSSLEELDRLLRTEWLPVFQLYSEEPEPDWAAFEHRFGRYIPRASPMPARQRLTPARLRHTLNKMSANSSVGADSWSVAELRLLSDDILQCLCELLDLVESTGRWPEDMCLGVISPILKDPGLPLTAGNTRPITVMSTVYRLWAATRMQELVEWQETWISAHVASYRPQMGCEDLWMAEALRVEHALLTGEGLAGISLDFSKAFDRLPHSVLLNIARCVGMDEHILCGLSGMYSQLRRAFKVGQHIGEPFTSTNGILQGCPMSVLLLNMFVEVWSRAVQEEAGPDCKPQAYADDIGATAPTKGHIDIVCSVTEAYAKLTGMEINIDKSCVWATTMELRIRLKRGCHINGRVLPHVMTDRRLGAFLSYSRKRALTRLSRTLEACKAMCCRTQELPLPLFARALIVAGLILPKALYACGAAPPPKKDLLALRAACARAIWGQRNKWRANEALFTFIVPGHRMDPVQVCHYWTILTMRRVLARHQELWDLYCNVLDIRFTSWRECEHTGGPVAALLRSLTGISASLTNPGLLRYRAPSNEMFELSLVDSDAKRFAHEIRDAARGEQWFRLAARRETFDGLEYGADRKATDVLLRDKLPGLQKHRLRTIMVGGVATKHRLYRAKILDNNACPCCLEAAETLIHICDECSALDPIRFRDFTRAEWELLPPCLRYHGIMPLANDGLPMRFLEDEENGKAALAAEVQYTLLDLMAARQDSSLQPQPRW